MEPVHLLDDDFKKVSECKSLVDIYEQKMAENKANTDDIQSGITDIKRLTRESIKEFKATKNKARDEDVAKLVQKSYESQQKIFLDIILAMRYELEQYESHVSSGSRSGHEKLAAAVAFILDKDKEIMSAITSNKYVPCLQRMIELRESVQRIVLTYRKDWSFTFGREAYMELYTKMQSVTKIPAPQPAPVQQTNEAIPMTSVMEEKQPQLKAV